MIGIRSKLALDNHGRRSLKDFYKPIREHKDGFSERELGSFTVDDERFSISRFSYPGAPAPDAVRIAVFGAIHGDEPVSALACRELLLALADQPHLADDFLVHVYPVCNPTGFLYNTRQSRSGKDLNREFWRSSPEPEVQILERELLHGDFHGIIQLHSDDTSEGVYGFVRGHTLTEHLLKPALRAAGEVLPRNRNATIDGFAARDGIIYDHYQGILKSPEGVPRVPFEIILETPQHAPLDLQVQALVVANITILSEYRRLLAFAANI